MGLAQEREKRLEDAGVTGALAKGAVEESFRLVLEHGISPFSVSSVQMQGMLMLRQGRYSEADQLTARAIAMRDDYIGYKMRGDAHYLQRRYVEAEADYREALKRVTDAQRAEVMHDLGVAVVSQGRTSECLQWFQKAIDIQPENADFHHHMAMMLILDGQDKAGWDRMQWRLKSPGVTGSFPFPQKYWKGEDLQGKTIVIRSEQGWGDTILFSRYLPWFTARAKRVYFYCQRALEPFIRRFYPDVCTWPNDAPIPLDFDYHMSIFCLPRLVPEMPPAPRAVKGRGQGIGVCWYGSPTHKADALRSVPIERFAPLAEAVDQKLVSLGYGFFWQMENGVVVSEKKPDFIEYCDIVRAHDWAQSADIVSGLDLVITVDTAIAHLAGFLGVETWLLLPYVPDYRWKMKGERTPWYPSMKLYRQPKLFDWDSVFERVEDDLRKRMKK